MMGLFSRTLRTREVIDAPVGLVWSVLSSTADYGAWNPFLPRVAGRVAPGERLELTIAPPGARAQSYRVRVTAVAPDREFSWLGTFHLPGLLDGHHSLRLSALGDGCTAVDHDETFTGLLVPALWPLFLTTRLRAGFLAMNAALNHRCRALHAALASA